jgi:hypothetical protein
MDDLSVSLLTRAQAAEFLTHNGYPIRRGTLDTMASRGGGPKFRKWGQRVLYQPSDLILWAQSRLGQPLSTSAERAGTS